MKSFSLKPQWFQILLALADQVAHGTAIMEEVLERTDGEMRLWPGTLYGALRDMCEAGLINEVKPPQDAPTEGGKRRFYQITGQGKVLLRSEVERLSSWVRAAELKRVIDAPEVS